MGLLVLSRKVSEGITITVPPSTETQTILLKLVEIRGDKSRIGIDADRSIAVHRDEIQRVIDDKPLPLLRIGDPLPGA